MNQEVTTDCLYSAWKRIPKYERIPYKEWVKDMYCLDEEIDADPQGYVTHRIIRRLTAHGRNKLARLG